MNHYWSLTKKSSNINLSCYLIFKTRMIKISTLSRTGWHPYYNQLYETVVYQLVSWGRCIWNTLHWRNFCHTPPWSPRKNNIVPPIIFKQNWSDSTTASNTVASRKIKPVSPLVVLPWYLLAVWPPKCAGCLYVAIIRRPWQTKCPNNLVSLNQVTDLGNCVSLDQLESSDPGFIEQIKVRPTKKSYCLATIFIYHYIDHSYLFLQNIPTSVETVQAKTPLRNTSRRL